MKFTTAQHNTVSGTQGLAFQSCLMRVRALEQVRSPSGRHFWKGVSYGMLMIGSNPETAYNFPKKYIK